MRSCNLRLTHYTSLLFNGYMEGAAESGERAAKQVLAKVGIRR